MMADEGCVTYGHVMTHDEWWESTGRSYAALRHALVSRPLTTDELKRVGEIGYSLLVQPMTPYYAAEKQAEFASLLSIQQSIQLAASRESKG